MTHSYAWIHVFSKLRSSPGPIVTPKCALPYAPTATLLTTAPVHANKPALIAPLLIPQQGAVCCSAPTTQKQRAPLGQRELARK